MTHGLFLAAMSSPVVLGAQHPFLPIPRTVLVSTKKELLCPPPLAHEHTRIPRMWVHDPMCERRFYNRGFFFLGPPLPGRFPLSQIPWKRAHRKQWQNRCNQAECFVQHIRVWYVGTRDSIKILNHV